MSSALASNTTLISQDVSENDIAYRGAKALAANPSLTSLEVTWIVLNRADLLSLTEAIIRNKNTKMSLHAFATIVHRSQAPSSIPEEVARIIGSFLTADTNFLDVIMQRAADRASRHMFFQPAGPVYLTIEPEELLAPANV